MARFLVLALCVALSSAAPQHLIPALSHGAVAAAGPVQYSAGPTLVREHAHAGPAIAQTHVQHGVVGQRTVLAGTKTVQVGHQYGVAGQSVHQPAAYSVVASPATNSQSTRPLPVPAVPIPSPAAAIPPPARNLGPAPLDAVTQERVLAPARTHTIITPTVTRVEPELQVNRYAVDVPKPIPVPVEKVVVHTKHVPRPYQVDVPTPVQVPQPYKVHQVKHVVQTPVVHKKTVTYQQPIINQHVQQVVAQAPAVAYAAAPAAIGAYAGAAVAPVAGIAAAPVAGIAAAPIAAATLA